MIKWNHYQIGIIIMNKKQSTILSVVKYNIGQAWRDQESNLRKTGIMPTDANIVADTIGKEKAALVKAVNDLKNQQAQVESQIKAAKDSSDIIKAGETVSNLSQALMIIKQRLEASNKALADFEVLGADNHLNMLMTAAKRNLAAIAAEKVKQELDTAFENIKALRATYSALCYSGTDDLNTALAKATPTAISERDMQEQLATIDWTALESEVTV
jgi:predicted  nucleic acid-binding Zn-ribbon protein